jgi:hypothetical protein
MIPVSYPTLSPAQFACCVWRPVDLGAPILVAYDVLVTGTSYADAVEQLYPAEAGDAPHLYLRKALRVLTERHTDRLRAYDNWAGDPLRFTPDQWMCSAIAPSRWKERAFEIRNCLVNGRTPPPDLRSSSTYPRILRRHFGNLLAYTNYRPGGVRP